MLGLQVDAPLHRELELLLRLLEHRDRLGVVHAHELGRRRCPASFATSALLDPLLEERHVVGALVEQRREDVLEEPLGERRVVGEIGERDLRLDHPELGEVAAGVRVLRAERRPERVDLGQRQAVRLDVELARHGEERLACRRSPARSRPCRPACAAGSRGRASRRGTAAPAPSASDAVMIGVLTQKKPLLVEEAVDRLRERVAHARRRADHVGARAQVRDLAQELDACAASAGSDRCPGRRPSRRP